MLDVLSDYDVQIRGFGLINVSLRFLLNQHAEVFNDIIYRLDKIVLSLIDTGERAVLATIISKS